MSETTTAGKLAGYGKSGQYGAEKRQSCERLRGSLETERSTFISHWRECSQFILPRRARFTSSDTNRGDKRNQQIIDSTATESAGVLAAGMMSGVTSPARPWFRLTVPDQDLAEQDDVKQYLHETERRMSTVFLHSNLYQKLPVLYGDLGVFATHAMAVMEDDESVIRCYDFPIGSYAVANDAKLRVRTFVRQFRLTVAQVIERWGNVDASGKADFQRGEKSNISVATQQNWQRGNENRMAWVDIVHVIQPNVSYDGTKIESKYKKYEEIYYEAGASGQSDATTGVLAHSGYDEFPVLVARWEVSGEDVYGTNCPGMKALGDIKALQLMEKRAAQAVEKMINPPLVGPPDLVNAKVSVLPGDITFSASPTDRGLRPIYEVRFDLQPLELKQQQIRLRIQRVFKEDLFLMLAQSDRREITAREIDERHEEKLLASGPVLEQLNQDVLDPLINRTFAIMARKGLLPEPPEVLQGATLRVEYISVMAQAQKMIALAGLERFAGFAGQIVETFPDAADRIDIDELLEQYADATGVAPKVLRSEEDANALRQQRAQAAAAQQGAENIPGIAGAAKALSETSTGGDSALAKLLAGSRARQALNATASPPASVLQ